MITDRLVGDALVVVSELVTNAVVHAGTDVELLCRLDSCSQECPVIAPGSTGTGGTTSGDASGAASAAGRALVVEVSDHHPERVVRDDGTERPHDSVEYGRGLRLVSGLSEAWGITYRSGAKTVWARLPLDDTEGRSGDPASAGGTQDAETLHGGPRDGEAQDGGAQKGGARNGTAQNGKAQDGRARDGKARNGGTDGG
ncbi:ATP-binding protein, partial [Streptomyces apricus]|uniref:ATP-binding protein n=1 Tax=Streptomyces apricus TaxID=1828112 RepID=UPI00165F131E